VDRTCIDCDACRRIAPAVFAEASDHSFVARQPADEAERRRALMALVSCPTGSIGTANRDDVRPALAAYPETVEEEVSFCGFTSASSFGAWSYFVERGLVAFRDACWYSWKDQIASMERLLDFAFEWVLPGHGAWHKAASSEEMRRELARCVAWMKTK
jgi:ferredoxin